MKSTKVKNKKRLSAILSVVLLIIIGAVCFYYFGASYEFYSYVKIEAQMPGLNDGFVPQGLCVIDESGDYLVSGYMKDTSKASRIYYVNKQTLVAKYVTLNLASAELNNGHFGGVATSGDSVWVASDGYLFYFALNDFKLAENEAELTPISTVQLDYATDFCYANGSNLYVGEFYRSGNYEVDESHYVTSEQGQTNHAIMAVYNIDSTGVHGLESLDPIMAVSIPDQVQGFCMTNSGKYVFSTSYSLPDSIIYVFDSTVATSSTVQINEKQVQVFAVFKEQLHKQIVAPCMAEGIDYHNGSVHIMFENACAKYKMVTRVREKNILSFEQE